LLLPTALAAWWRCPNHLQIKPDRQRSTLLQAVVVRQPVLGLVLRRGLTAHPTQLSRWFHTVKPINPFMQQSPKHPERMVFINETSVKTNMVKTTGWAPRSQRLIDHAPFRQWRTQSFIGALPHNRLDTPWVIVGVMNSAMFDLHVETQLVLTMRVGDLVILDKLSSPKSPGAARAMRGAGAWILFLPPHSSGLNTIEMAFSKLKVQSRKATALTYEELRQAVRHFCNLFTDEQ
jgi:hypothetical protein